MIETIISRDFGTPPSVATEFVTLEIDGTLVTVPVGTSVMRAAAENGVNIPKLCATDSLEPFGSCRLCLVEIEGTQSHKLQEVRKGVMDCTSPTTRSTASPAQPTANANCRTWPVSPVCAKYATASRASIT